MNNSIRTKFNPSSFLYSNLAPHPQMPADWSGAMNIEYKLGPGFAGQYEDR